WLFLGFFVAFAIKAPLVPFHTWLPDAGAEAPIGAGVLLVGVLDKVGTFGFLRYCLRLFPLASQRLAPLVLTLAVMRVLSAPLLAGTFLLACLASLALPGTNSFVSEFLVLVGSFPREPVYTVLATVGIIFAALYVLWVYQQTMQGPVRGAAVLGALERAGGP